MGELEPRGLEGQHGLGWRGRKWGDHEEAGAGGEVTKNQNEGKALGSEWKAESRPRRAQQTLEERAGRPGGGDGARFHCWWKEEVPRCSAPPSSPLYPPQRGVRTNNGEGRAGGQVPCSQILQPSDH